MRTACFFLLLCSLTLNAQEKSSGWSQKRSLPKWAREEFRNHTLDRDYTITYQLYPYYFRGDFNGDNRRDIAFLVENKINKKSGIVIIHGKFPQKIHTQYFILGGGKSFSSTGDDTKWINVWSFVEKEKASLILGNIKLPPLNGDVIKVEGRDGKKGLIYWDGKKYAWYKLK